MKKGTPLHLLHKTRREKEEGDHLVQEIMPLNQRTQIED